MRLSLRGLTTNWKLKLAALALAILLWAVVSAEQVTTQWIPVRVDPVVRDPGYVLTGGPEPAEVRVLFRGPGRELWQVALDRPVLTLPIRDVGSARSFVVDPAMVRVREGLRVAAQDVRPAVVRLDLQRVATKTVPVRAQIGSRSRSRYVIGDSVGITPAAVRLTGPEEALARVDAVVTRPFEIVPETDSTFTRRIGIDTAELDGITVSAREVRVSGSVDRRVDRAVSGVPVSVPAGFAATPRTVEVHVQGRGRVVGTLFPQNLRASVRADSIPARVPPAGVDVPVVVDGLPPGTAARTVPLRIHVTPAQPAAPAPADSAAGGAPR